MVEDKGQYDILDEVRRLLSELESKNPPSDLWVRLEALRDYDPIVFEAIYVWIFAQGIGPGEFIDEWREMRPMIVK